MEADQPPTTKLIKCPDLPSSRQTSHGFYDACGNKIVKMRVVVPSVKHKLPQKRVVARSWTFHSDHYQHNHQLNIVQQLWDAQHATTDALTPVAKIALQQIHRKLYGYAQQDQTKSNYCVDKFLTLAVILRSMLDCALRCHYCSVQMSVLYDLSREGTQWTVDRINNQEGHNVDNFYLACLDCNLKRRCRSDAKFFSYKQMVLVKATEELMSTDLVPPLDDLERKEEDYDSTASI